jgi:hypothetical protein
MKLKLISIIPFNTAKKLLELKECLIRKQLEEQGNEVDQLLKNGLLIQTRKKGGVKC